MYFQFRGGLGNQLFQLAYIYFALSKTYKEENLSWEFWNLDSRSFEINDLVEDSKFLTVSRGNEKVNNIFHLDKHNNEGKWTKIWGMFQYFCNLLIRQIIKSYLLIVNHTVFLKTNLSLRVKELEIHERREHTYARYPRLVGKLQYRTIGFFQHWKYVDFSWENLKEDIIAKLEKTIDISEELNLNPFKVIIHIRGGDSLDTSRGYVNLDSRYYFNAMKLLEKSGEVLTLSKRDIIVVTDDVKYAKKICQNLEIPISKILGPNDADAWQTIKLMSRAEMVISANSTLSWWGGFLASKLRKEIELGEERKVTWILPKIWRTNQDIAKYLFHPEAIIMDI